MLEFHFHVFRGDGVRQQAADLLSRLPTEGTNNTALEDAISVMWGNEIDDTEQNCLSYISGDITNTLMYVKLERAEFHNPTSADFFKTESKDVSCQQAVKKVGLNGTEFSLKKDGIIIRRTPIEEAVHKFVPQTMCQRVMCLSQYQVLADNHRQL